MGVSALNRLIKKSLVFLIALCLLTQPVFAQEAAKDKLFFFDNFSGGLNTQLKPDLLPKNQATVADNVRFSDTIGSITKRPLLLTYGSADASEAITGMHRLYLSDGTKVLIVTHGDEIETGADATGTFTAILDVATANYRWQWLTWHDLAIGMDGYNAPVKYDGSSASATYLGSCLATDAGDGAGPNGTYTYKVTFYTATYECSLDTASNSITVTDNDIDLTMIPIGPDTYLAEDVVGRKIYRTSAGGIDYKLLSNGTIANNTAVTLTDSDADGARGAALSPDATEAPPKGRLCEIHHNRLWIANNPDAPSRLYYSSDSSHDYFESDGYFNVRANDGDGITFIKNLLGTLVVGKNNSIQKMYTNIDDPDVGWEIGDPFNTIGCQARYSAVTTPAGIIYLSAKGLYNFNGQYSKLISSAVLQETSDISETNFNNCWGSYHNMVYRLAYPSKAIGISTNNRVLVYEELTNTFSIDKANINAYCSFNSGTDWGVLYAGSSLTGAVYSFSQSTNAMVHKKHSDFSGTWDDCRYIPTGVPGGDENNPILEIARIETINSLSGTINALTGDINREDTGGTYTSPVLNIKVDSFDKIYWNEVIPGSGGSITFAVRSGASAAACASASWSSEYSDGSGTDISALTGNDFIQYRATFTATDIDYSPNLVNAENFVVKITYDTESTTSETSIDMRWESGWLDLGYPGYTKSLKKLLTRHEGDTGTYTITFENFGGDTDTFTVDLTQNPSSYKEYFTNGRFIGDLIKLKITKSDANDLRVEKIGLLFDVEPLF